MSSRERIEISGILLTESRGAILFSDDGSDARGKWLPKSQLDIQRGKGQDITIELPEWLAKKEGLI